MNYEDFLTTVCERIKLELPPDVSVALQKVYKNNGLLLDGLTISTDGVNVSPTIFLNYYYEKEENAPDFDAICKDILRTYERNKSTQNIEVDFFTDYRLVCEHLAYRLVNYEKNKELLKTVPHIRYLDLAIVFYCLLHVPDKGNATILIHHSHLKLWNVTVENLYQKTRETTPALLPYDFDDMGAMLRKMFTALPLPPDAMNVCPMYLLTNTHKLYGASCILYPKLLSEIAGRLHADLFLLPSSIHEIIILPAADRSQSDVLTQMVTDINASELAAEEILSDHVYYYSRSGKSLEVCP